MCNLLYADVDHAGILLLLLDLDSDLITTYAYWIQIQILHESDMLGLLWLY